jgi:hypothetical protein
MLQAATSRDGFATAELKDVWGASRRVLRRQGRFLFWFDVLIMAEAELFVFLAHNKHSTPKLSIKKHRASASVANAS